MQNESKEIDISQFSSDSYITNQLNSLSKSRRKVVSELTNEERDLYFRVLSSITNNDKSLLTDSNIGDSRILAEPFQISWRKVHCAQDKLRVQLLHKITRKVLVKGLPTRIGTHTSFDDLFLGLDNKGKYVFGVFELKTNKIGSTSLRIDKGTEAGKLIAFNLKKSSKDLEDKLIADGIDNKVAEKIAKALYERSRLSSNAIGIDFLRKAADANFPKSFQDSISKDEINRVLEAAIKQNMLIALIKTGYSFKFKEDGEHSSIAKNTTNDVTNQLILKYKSRFGKPFNLLITGDVFKVDYNSQSLKLKIPRFSINVLSSSGLSYRQKKAYFNLNKLFMKSLKKADLSLTDAKNNILATNQIIKKVNLLQTSIYKSLIKSQLFSDFQLFHKGSMFFFLETLSGEKNEKRIFKYLQNFSVNNGIANYHYHQKWVIPFGKELSSIFGGLIEESEDSRNFRLLLYKNLLKNSEFDVEIKEIEEIEEKISKDSNLEEYLIQNFRSDIKVPDGYFWTQGSSSTRMRKALVFYDEQKNKPKQLFGCNLYLGYNFQYLLRDLNLEPILLQNPITFGINDGKLIADFNCDMNKKISNAWIRYLSNESKISYKSLLRLKKRLGPGGGVDLLYPQENTELIQILVSILSKFQENWDRVTKYLQQEINTNQLKWEVETLKKNDPKLSVDKTGNMKVNDEKVIMRLGTLDGINWRTTRPVYCIANSSGWFSDVASLFENVFKETIKSK